MIFDNDGLPFHGQDGFRFAGPDGRTWETCSEFTIGAVWKGFGRGIRTDEMGSYECEREHPGSAIAYARVLNFLTADEKKARQIFHGDVYHVQHMRKLGQHAGWRTLDELADAAGVNRSTLRVALKRSKDAGDPGDPIPAELAEKIHPALISLTEGRRIELLHLRSQREFAARNDEIRRAGGIFWDADKG